MLTEISLILETEMLIAKTKRLLLREFNSDDISALAKILGDPVVMKFSSNGVLTEASTAKFIKWCERSYRENGYGQWALLEKNAGTLIGFCGLSHTILDGVNEIEVAYRLAPDYWGRGLASEALVKVLEHGFSTCNIQSIVGIVSHFHQPSIRVLKRLDSRLSKRLNMVDGMFVSIIKLSFFDEEIEFLKEPDSSF
jgi:ribosomal-protein-alanine N-acetyltransferase